MTPKNIEMRESERELDVVCTLMHSDVYILQYDHTNDKTAAAETANTHYFMCAF